MSGGEEARECGSGGLWTLRGGVKVGAGGKVKTVSPFQPQFSFTHTANHLQFLVTLFTLLALLPPLTLFTLFILQDLLYTA